MNSTTSLGPDTGLLLICRHAKAEKREPGQADFDRPLSPRGERDAAEMGRRLARRGILPDRIQTSPAPRALATARHYADQLGIPTDQMRCAKEQYEASVPVLVALLRKTDPSVGVLMLVGHNPESTALANELGGTAIENIPTGGIVALAFPSRDWADLAKGCGSLLFFDYPKNQE